MSPIRTSRATNAGLVCSLILVLAACSGSAPTASAERPSSTATTPSLGSGERLLHAGTYRVGLNEIAPGGAEIPPILITVPDGWNSLDGWVLHRGALGEPSVAVMFWDVDEVYGHPCQWSGTLFDPGPSVEDLTDALVDIPLRNASPPTDVTLDGYAGKYLEWSVPADIEMNDEGNFPECDAGPDGHHDFNSWTGNGWASNRYQQGPGQVDQLWILDVNGSRLVVDAFYMPSTTDEDREELRDVVESIRFIGD